MALSSNNGPDCTIGPKARSLMTLALLVLSAASLAACSATDVMDAAAAHRPTEHATRAGAVTSGISHIVIITMENRSFDEMFGTYPGVHGLPNPLPCNLDPASGQSVCSYHSTDLVEHGGPHGDLAERVDLDGGKLDGFIVAAEMVRKGNKDYDPFPDEVMGYHTCAEIPVYCTYARSGVLADNFYSATTSFSTPAHLYMVSNWSAACTVPGDASSCTSFNDPNIHENPPPDFAWTDVTWLLHHAGVTWGYFVYSNNAPMLPDDDADAEAPSPDAFYNTLGVWNPLPAFDDVRLDGETGDLQPGSRFLTEVKTGTLPTVSWVIPPFKSSDHPTASLADGQVWLQQQVSAVKTSPIAGSTLILVWWDDWGGFYDHVIPFTVDAQGYGFRTPLILMGPMVKAGSIDHQLLSTDAFNKLIEDLYLGGQRLDPRTDGRPDPRPQVREANPHLGDLRLDLKPPLSAGIRN